MEEWKGRLGDNDYHGGNHPDEADFAVIIIYFYNFRENYIQYYIKYYIKTIKFKYKYILFINFFKLYSVLKAKHNS